MAESPQQIPFTVSGLRVLAQHGFALELDRRSGPAFAYKAGQFAMVTVRDKATGLEHKKALSFSSSPTDAHTLQFGFEQRGFFTQALARLKPGDTVVLRAPLGYFTLPEHIQSPLLMLAGGTGISPLLGILRFIAATGIQNPIDVLYSSRSVDDILFRTELDQMTQARPQTRIQYTISTGDPEQGMLRGRISVDMLRAFAPDMTIPLYFLSGPPEMVQDLIKMLVAEGVDRDRILTEQYD